MKLNLKRPLIVFDLETTGLNITKDKIIELSYVKVYPDGTEDPHRYRFNPGMPIPQPSIEVHGITDDMVANEPLFKERARLIAKDFEGCDIAGFNSNNFDIPLLAQEMMNAGVDINLSSRKFIDVQTIFHKKEKRDLEAACQFYCGHPMQNHHSSMDDTLTTLEVLKAQLDYYSHTDEPLQNDVDFLAAYSSHNRKVDLVGRIVYNEAGKEIFNFGKYKGQLVEDVLRRDPGYYGWMLQGDFPENTKQVLTRIKLRLKK